MLRHLLHRTASVVACSLHTQTPHAQMDLHSIVSGLERLAPTDRAEDWDNVGLLIEPSGNPVVQRILVTNDLTESVLEEAASLPGKKVNLIISYHPPIFTPIRRLTQVSSKERIVLQCVSSQMAVYSPHTALDRRINSWLVQGLGSGTLTHFTSTADTKDPNEGNGSLYTLSDPVALSTIVSRVKSHLSLPYIRLATREGASSDGHQVSTIAAVAGSGASLLRAVKADVYLTGEMSHHSVLEATAKGTAVILTEHSNCERPYMWKVYKELVEGPEGVDGQVEVTMSQVDKDPLNIA